MEQIKAIYRARHAHPKTMELMMLPCLVRDTRDTVNLGLRLDIQGW